MHSLASLLDHQPPPRRRALPAGAHANGLTRIESRPKADSMRPRHIRADEQSSRGHARLTRTISNLRRGLLICGLVALACAPAAAPAARPANVEVVVTLKRPPLAEAFVRQHTLAFSSFARPHRLLLSTPASRNYLRQLD